MYILTSVMMIYYYRQEWGRYTRGCDCIIFVIDAHAMHLLPDAKAGKQIQRNI